MNQHALDVLEFGKVIDQIIEYTITQQAAKRLQELRPAAEVEIITNWMAETTEAVRILKKNSSVPLSSMAGMENIIAKAPKGIILSIGDLTSCQNFLESVKRIRKFMDGMQYIAPRISSYASSMYELSSLSEEIGKCIVNGRVDDRASSQLASIRKRLRIVEDRIKHRLDDIMRSCANTGILQEAIVTMRNGRHTIPVKRQYIKRLPGQVLDISSTGSTAFIEPAAVAKLQEELNLLVIEEANEVSRILSVLSGEVMNHVHEISVNIEAMAHYDFIFAKGKHSRSLDMREVALNQEKRMVIKKGRHPLLGRSCVPLDFSIGEKYRALVITGPNTGGKTVALKTVGLLSMMVQAGLHVPVAEGSEFTVFSDILADIGDGQSIEQSLSTFSSHVKNILNIVQNCNYNTLVIMDELGAGTEPKEGCGFAIAVLEEVFRKGATIVATTHFGEIKEYALNTPGFENGSMAFDIETLSPLYQLNIGNWGESNALLIALRLGMETQIVERAHEITYGEKKSYVDYNDHIKPFMENHSLQQKSVSQLSEPERKKTYRQIERRKQYKRKDLKVGDRVYISTMQRTGIVYEEENSRGDLVVLVMNKKYVINKKRLTLCIDRKDLYPENYDMDIIFESKENRKKRKLMTKRHIKGLVIEKGPEEY
ncbi:MAG: endonuclease MutS2 [Syntrophomonadaceae bacterium]|jgi:DNA mismatch repair protein MutS2